MAQLQALQQVGVVGGARGGGGLNQESQPMSRRGCGLTSGAPTRLGSRWGQTTYWPSRGRLNFDDSNQ